MLTCDHERLIWHGTEASRHVHLLAKRWMLRVKTLRAWRQRNVGPRWYILGRHVRYHVAEVLVFESHALPQWLSLEAAEHQLEQTSKSGKFLVQDDSPPPANFLDAKTLAVYTKSRA